MPLAEEFPWTAPVMFFMMTTISLGVMNLILAVTLGAVAFAIIDLLEKKMDCCF